CSSDTRRGEQSGRHSGQPARNLPVGSRKIIRAGSLCRLRCIPEDEPREGPEEQGQGNDRRTDIDVKSPAAESPPDCVIRLQERNCENCGGSDLEQLWHQSFTARTRSGNYIFDVNNVVCTNCGFVFVSPVFNEADLTDYYASSFSAFADAAPDYDIARRLAFLDKVAPKGDLFVEVGANRPMEFHRRLKEIYGKVATVEINDSVSSDHRSLAAMPDACVAVVAHYFVLEHIPQVRKF